MEGLICDLERIQARQNMALPLPSVWHTLLPQQEVTSVRQLLLLAIVRVVGVMLITSCVHFSTV